MAGSALRLCLLLLCLALPFPLRADTQSTGTPTAADTPSHEIILLVGAPGQEQYANAFATAAQVWMETALKIGARITVVGLDARSSAESHAEKHAEDPSDREHLQRRLRTLDPDSPVPLWFVYLGHGTHDRKQAWLNLRGPDVSGAELAEWLSPLSQRTLLFIHGGSASGPLLPLLSGPNRIVITATRSGEEVNYARFGEYFAQAISSLDADIDQDGATSVLEAYLLASKQTQGFYTEANRMATEHALLEDNNDRLGTPPEWFQGVRVVKRPDNKTAAPDGFRAHQITLVDPPNAPLLSPDDRRERDRLERDLEAVRAKRDQLPEAQYLDELERVLRELGRFYDS